MNRMLDLELTHATVVYINDFLDNKESERLLFELKHKTQWHQPRVKLFGRIYHSPRMTAWYGDPEAVYTFSGLKNIPIPWTPALSSLRAMLQTRLNEPFNSVLLNWYRDGNDSMGWHSDNEKELGVMPIIASISLGGERDFVLKHKKQNVTDTEKIKLANGSLLVMSGTTQQYWKHCLPKTRKPVTERINLTFRKIVVYD